MLDCNSDGSLQQMPVECWSLSGYIYLIISDFIVCWHIFEKFARKSYESPENREKIMTSARGTQARARAWKADMRYIFQSLRNFSLHTMT